MAINSHRIRVGARVTIAPRGRKKIYTADFRISGRHCRRSLHTANQRVAIQRAKKLDDTLDLGETPFFETPQLEQEHVQPPSLSLRQAMDDYIAFKTGEGLAPRTLVKYQGILASFHEFANAVNCTLVTDVKIKTFDDYRNSRRAVLGDKSMHHEAQLLKAFFAWCHERDYVKRNILERRRFTPPRPVRIARVLTIDQVNQLVASAPQRIRAPLAVIAFTGMRSGECQRLRVEDVDFQHGWIQIVSRQGLETKTRNSWKVPIHPALRTILQYARPIKKGYFFTAAPSKKFPAGEHWINTKRLNETFQDLLGTLKIEAGRKKGGFSLHDLRHAFKSIAIVHGVPREYVDCWQGHTGVRSASDLYVHTFDAESQRLLANVPFRAPGLEQR